MRIVKWLKEPIQI